MMCTRDQNQDGGWVSERHQCLWKWLFRAATWNLVGGTHKGRQHHQIMTVKERLWTLGAWPRAVEIGNGGKKPQPGGQGWAQCNGSSRQVHGKVLWPLSLREWGTTANGAPRASLTLAISLASKSRRRRRHSLLLYQLGSASVKTERPSVQKAANIHTLTGLRLFSKWSKFL